MSTADIVIGDPIRLDTVGGTIEVRHLKALSPTETAPGEGLIAIGRMAEPDPYPVRVQSSCVFSEALGAVDCDCALQLKAAIKLVAASGGAVVYLYEEGRGVGLRKKMEAIRLQQLAGMDTVAAFAHLGWRADPREHEFAAAALRELFGDRRVRLLTNNPAKAQALKRGGVNVVEEEQLIVRSTPQVEDYLREKASILGHRVDER